MKFTTSVLGAALVLGATLPCLAQSTPPMTSTMPAMAMSAQDQLFVARAAEGNLAEVTLSQLALSKSKTPGVQNVARTIIQGHTQAQSELMGLMQRKGMMMRPMLSPTHVAVQNTLKKSKRDNFDKMYMAGQTDDHENTIALFQSQIENGQDPDLKAYASKYLPDIVGHTIQIYMVAKQVGAPGSELRPAMPPVPPGVTPTMMGRPIDMSSPQAMMNSMNMGGSNMDTMSGNTTNMNNTNMSGMNNPSSSTLTPLNSAPVPAS